MSNATVRPLTVAHVVESSDGGVSSFVSMLISEQRADPLFESVHLLADQYSLDERLLRSADVVHHYQSSRNPARVPAICMDLRQKLKKISPDVVVLHSTFPGLWGRLIGGRWKSIYCAHGWAFNRDTNQLIKMAYGAVEATLSYRTHALVSISGDEFKSAQRFGIRQSRHHVVPHGIEAACPSDGPLLPSKSDILDLAFVGRFERPKGIDILYEIFDDPRLAHINVWVVGGDVRGAKEYELPSLPNIHRLGWLSRDQVDTVLQQVDALIAPSRWEAFGLAAVEAMRNKKAVIASRVGGLSELVIDHVNGRFIDIHDLDSCRTLLLGLNRTETAKMGEAGFALFERHHKWEVCYRKWQEIILEAASY